MSVLYVLVPLALVFSGLAVWAFVASTRQGQFDDLETPGLRMLLDDESCPASPERLRKKSVTR